MLRPEEFPTLLEPGTYSSRTEEQRRIRNEQRRLNPPRDITDDMEVVTVHSDGDADDV